MMRRRIARRALTATTLALTLGLAAPTQAAAAGWADRGSDPLSGLVQWLEELWNETGAALTTLFDADTAGNGPHPGSSGPGEGDGYQGSNGEGENPHAGNSTVKPRRGGGIDPDGLD